MMTCHRYERVFAMVPSTPIQNWTAVGMYFHDGADMSSDEVVREPIVALAVFREALIDLRDLREIDECKECGERLLANESIEHLPCIMSADGLESVEEAFNGAGKGSTLVGIYHGDEQPDEAALSFARERLARRMASLAKSRAPAALKAE